MKNKLLLLGAMIAMIFSMHANYSENAVILGDIDDYIQNRIHALHLTHNEESEMLELFEKGQTKLLQQIFSYIKSLFSNEEYKKDFIRSYQLGLEGNDEEVTRLGIAMSEKYFDREFSIQLCDAMINYCLFCREVVADDNNSPEFCYKLGLFLFFKAIELGSESIGLDLLNVLNPDGMKSEEVERGD